MSKSDNIPMASRIDWEALRIMAEQARRHAYAPYSRFDVGAALLASSGKVYVGANVENASYGLCLCAERGAISAAVVHGERSFTALVVVAPQAATPCGMCRQVLAEFAPSFALRCYVGAQLTLDTQVADLLPFAFSLTP